MSPKFAFFLLIVIISSNLYSQSTTKFIDTGSVNNQFDYIITKSNTYQDYKVIKANWLLKLKSNVIDSLSVSKNTISNSLNILESHNQTIDSLKIALINSENTLHTLNNEKESISFLGIQFSKAFFKTLIVLIIAALGLLLALFIGKFKRSNVITIQSKLALKEVEEEFDIHRKNALEREQKVMRKLQDELNKQRKE